MDSLKGKGCKPAKQQQKHLWIEPVMGTWDKVFGSGFGRGTQKGHDGYIFSVPF